ARPWCSPATTGPCCRRCPTGRDSSSAGERTTGPIPGPMSTDGLAAAQKKMAEAGVAQTAIDVFSHYYGQLEEGVTGTIPEDTIDPYLDPPLLEDVSIEPAHAKQVFDQLAIINLNGGLGTSMGLDQAKSLLPVRDGRSFLDIIVEQVLAA